MRGQSGVCVFVCIQKTSNNQGVQWVNWLPANMRCHKDGYYLHTHSSKAAASTFECEVC